jgi:hypothetical protein
MDPQLGDDIMSLWETIVNFFKKLFGKKKPAPVAPATIELVWSVATLNPDGGTQCLPKDGTNGSASSTDWLLGQLPVGWPGVMYKASKMTIDASDAPGYLNVSLQRYIGGQPIPGWVPGAVLTEGATHVELDLGGAFVEGHTSMQAQAALSPLANSTSIHNVKVKMFLVKA